MIRAVTKRVKEAGAKVEIKEVNQASQEDDLKVHKPFVLIGSSNSSDSERVCADSQETLTISSKGISVLLELVQCTYLPVSRFIMSSSIEKEAKFVSLAPVYIDALDNSMETVKEIGIILKELEKKRLITLDYDIPLQDYDYKQHTNSVIFAYFTESVNEGKRNPSFLCDTANIELGSMALTELGERVSCRLGKIAAC
ncbi:hypothetical protein [Desulfosporosinus fructosivorans]|uniref:hypothetical protein n=1 Tax=Desulfosporosinus fructosivorans TaxID=2018669 RepID=UPI001FB0E2AB|nr:hypothetical protein [Desulfosporosinus fructosivorans]